MLRFFFIEYGAQDEIETSYEEGCNRIQKTFDTILWLVDFPFDPGGGGGGGGKKPFHDARIPFSSLDLGGCLRDATGYICMIPENWTAPRLTGGIYSTVRSRRCTLVEKYMPPPPLSYRIRKLAGRRGQIGLSAIKHGIRSNRSERASSFIFIGSTPSPARHTCPLLTILPADCKIPHSADRSPARRHPDPVSNHIKSRRLSIDRGR